MDEMLERPYTSPTETSSDGPALAVLGDHLYIAWVGSGNDHLYLMPSVDLGNGILGFNSNAKVVVDHGQAEEVHSLGGPGLAATADGHLLLAWTHNDSGILSPHAARSMFGIYFDQGLNRAGFLASLDTSDDGPAVCYWANGNGLNTAWKGSGNDNLNVMHDMDTFSKSISGETSPYRPALCTADWPNFTIYMAWTGEGDGELNLMHCDNTHPFVGQAADPTVFDGATKVTLNNEHSPAAPAIAALGKGLYLCWQGEDKHLNVMGMDLGSPDRSKRVSGQTTAHHPAIAAYRGLLFVAWTGENEHLNVAQMAPLYSPVAP
jgi:hypothetical protein